MKCLGARHPSREWLIILIIYKEIQGYHLLSSTKNRRSWSRIVRDRRVYWRRPLGIESWRLSIRIRTKNILLLITNRKTTKWIKNLSSISLMSLARNKSKLKTINLANSSSRIKLLTWSKTKCLFSSCIKYKRSLLSCTRTHISLDYLLYL